MSDTGTAMTGTLTIAATADGNYTGQFTAPAIPAPVPIGSVAVNGNEVLVVLRTSANTLALVYVERTADGTFKGTVVALRGGRPVLVRDVADVREGAAFKRGEGSRNGKPAVIIGVQKQPGANPVTTCHGKRSRHKLRT
jgi:multidrug efflux pump subunit AcrB